jgi:hypothetical protein
MSDDWLPPKEHYIKNQANFDKQAKEAIETIFADLQSKETTLKEHGLSISKDSTWLEVKRGPLVFVTASFNFDAAGGCRIINHIEMFLQNLSYFDFKEPADGIAAFKKQMKEALNKFYKNREMFASLKLA